MLESVPIYDTLWKWSLTLRLPQYPFRLFRWYHCTNQLFNPSVLLIQLSGYFVIHLQNIYQPVFILKLVPLHFTRISPYSCYSLSFSNYALIY